MTLIRGDSFLIGRRNSGIYLQGAMRDLAGLKMPQVILKPCKKRQKKGHGLPRSHDIRTRKDSTNQAIEMLKAVK